ncbi:MAG: hypothetical protein Q9221_002680 [Calogaya cf. arnoldii]
MSADESAVPNEHRYTGVKGSKYISTRLLNHNGITIAFALGRAKGKAKEDEISFFDYSILNGEVQGPNANVRNPAPTEKLDSQCWFENVRSLRFPTEVRSVGEEAVPVYQIPALDRTGRPVTQQETNKLNLWLSTSLCLMDRTITNFEVVSDGRYIYLFRQSVKASSMPLHMKTAGTALPPVDNSLLCDRFSLVGASLSGALEVRFRRSRQKRLALNEQDTLSVRDINDVPFFEPTFSLGFVQNLTDGRFTVIRTPTMTNDVFRWMIFAFSGVSRQIECFTTDVASDGLFDLHGQVYYTCDAVDHTKTFSSAPGSCTALKTSTGGACGNAKKPLVPKSSLSERAISLQNSTREALIRLQKPIDLSGTSFEGGFTIEAWVHPIWAENTKVEGVTRQEHNMLGTTGNDENTPGVAVEVTESLSQTTGPEPPTLPGSSFCLFSIVQEEDLSNAFPSVFIDDHLRLVLRRPEQSMPLLASENGLKADFWNHVAITSTGKPEWNIKLIVNGVWPENTSCILPCGSQPIFLHNLASEGASTHSRFQGQVDEVRVWRHPLHPATIRSRMSSRASGMEPFLEACWHFDEGTGTRAFDATVNGHDLEIVSPNSETPLSGLWQPSTAPLVNQAGLTRRTVRLAPDISVEGGLNAGVYYEQISVLKADSPSSNGMAEDQTSSGESKPLKRGARLLLSFVARSKKVEGYPENERAVKGDKTVIGDIQSRSHLAVLDFGLMSDGTLCDFPATIGLAGLPVAANTLSGDQSARRASTALLYVDAQGTEVFGGILACEEAQCGQDSPCIWDSATGSITVFFRNTLGRFSALTYDVSRSIVAAPLPIFGEHQGLMAASKLRNANQVTVQRTQSSWAPPEVAVNLNVIAPMANGASSVCEQWQGIPSDPKRFCQILNGADIPSFNVLGTVALYEENTQGTPLGNDSGEIIGSKIILQEPLTTNVPIASCITIGAIHYQTLRGSPLGGKSILVSTPYFPSKKSTSIPPPQKGQKVVLIGYDYEHLVSCEGKPTGDFTQGSTIIGMIHSESSVDSSLYPLPELSRKELANARCESLIPGEGSSPFFFSPLRSSALQLSEGNVYSMLGEAVTTSSGFGLAFESWIKVDKVTESVLVAYTSQRLPRNEPTSTEPTDTEPTGTEQQTFILGIPASSDSSKEFDLVGNVNGSLFLVKRFPALTQYQWVHFACSISNSFALRFSGSNYVDLGTAAELNVSDFSLAFTLQLDQIGPGEQIVFTKSAAADITKPVHVKIVKSGVLRLSYWAEGEKSGSPVEERWVESPTLKPLLAKVPYKVFISRKRIFNQKANQAPQSVQLVTMCAWKTDGNVYFKSPPDDTLAVLQKSEEDGTLDQHLNAHTTAEACGLAQPNEAPLSVGGAPWSIGQGLTGSVGHVRLYSSAIAVPSTPAALCTPNTSERSLIGAWSFRDAEGFVLVDDSGRNHGKLKGDPEWILSPYEPDHQLSIFINGIRTKTSQGPNSLLLKHPAGPHQLTLGNSIHGDKVTRFLALGNTFTGEFDELRIWNTPRTKENICDAMNSRLSEVPTDMAVYLPFDDLHFSKSSTNTTTKDFGILTDASINCWHLTPLHEAQPQKVLSEALISQDAPCVNHVLDTAISQKDKQRGAVTAARPSVTEYGDMQISASGGMEGTFKRAYSYIDTQGQWRLETGFRIGSLLTEWVSQIQTSPTLIGYIEGAPPFPVENFLTRDKEPSSAIRFSHAQKCTYSYSSNIETGTDSSLELSRGAGAEWEVSAGMGVETKISAGEVKGTVKDNIDVSSAQVRNKVNATTTNTNLEMRVEATGAWTSQSSHGKDDVFEPANTGLALVESEVADVFALRLKMRGPIQPLIAYQMRPNPDIPKDRNLISFRLNSLYTKQGCLDGRRGLKHDEPYPPSDLPPKEASYYKPVEAYALKDRIRRAEEQLSGEYERYQVDGGRNKELPKRSQRNICNSYVWTADGGTFQETHSTMDMVQSEVGGNSSTSESLGASFEMELSAGAVLMTASVDALLSTHFNLSLTKEKNSESAFELIAEMPPAVDIRYLDTKKQLVKRPGAVDSYRWMSFWLEPSVEGTDAFFKQVVDPEWVEGSPEPNARLLLKLRDDLNKQTGNARTKAWRVLHRCTYVNRVLEPVSASGKPDLFLPPPPTEKESKKSALLADVSCNWLILMNLEPFVRGAESRAELAGLAQPHVAKLYPSLRSQPRFYVQLLELLADYIGLP